MIVKRLEPGYYVIDFDDGVRWATLERSRRGGWYVRICRNMRQMTGAPLSITEADTLSQAKRTAIAQLTASASLKVVR